MGVSVGLKGDKQNSVEDRESVQGDRDGKTDKGGNTSEAMWPRKRDFQMRVSLS